ncbi:MAG: xylulokinase, partial [Clostridia bacterium]|nr:xylulokinase [Clostridia bacterium]
MNTYLGIDLGTSSVKLLLVAANGKILNAVTKEYPIFYPQSGWSEQRPEDWLSATIQGINELLIGYRREDVKGVSVGGQMHGLVMLDREGEVIRPAILWNDGRTQAQTDYLNQTVGREKLSACTANIAFA